jgi:hypothetical protein
MAHGPASPQGIEDGTLKLARRRRLVCGAEARANSIPDHPDNCGPLRPSWFTDSAKAVNVRAMSSIANAYDSVPYPGRAFLQTHPDRLAVIGTLLGMNPPRWKIVECWKSLAAMEAI